ncbi:hypothetical protein AVEN_267650-1 [Araneus ventricosus]|uniref:Uncharacterized protein n=1 Tax=Araneus ventricosus TaxID=182803 RepID=A0A4Y2PJZ4_ARAVE|nr:hypothetical protein AVEN_267650-1 [Araneus ventricosus]
MSEQQDILNSMSLLMWGSSSRSFDAMDIKLTRPGFGVIALYKMDDVLQNLRKSCEDILLMRTRDDCFHMTIFQVFIMFHNDYNPFSLPNNLLECLHNYIHKAIKVDMAEINKDLETLSRYSVTNNWCLLGREYPSHLVLEVSCKAVCNVLQNFKEKVNHIGHKWMVHLVHELQKRNFNAKIEQSDVGSKLSSNGWDLIIGYTGNPDYKTHVTMGMLPTTDPRLNEAILKVHENPERNIAVKFSSEEVSGGSLIKSMKAMVEAYRSQELRNLKDDDIGEFPTLRAQVNHARAGKVVEMSRSLIDEWGKVKIKMLHEKLEKKNLFLTFSRIHMGVLNMERVQNFEPVSTD